MKRRNRMRRKSRDEIKKTGSRQNSTITLINIVFLLLIFYVVSSELTPPISNSIELVETDMIHSTYPSDALIIRADGTMLSRENITTVSQYIQMLSHHQNANDKISIIPDKSLSAKTLIKISNQLQQEWGGAIFLVTQRGLYNDAKQ